MRPKTAAWLRQHCGEGGSTTLAAAWRSYESFPDNLPGPRTVNGLMRDLQAADYRVAYGVVQGMSLVASPPEAPAPATFVPPLFDSWLSTCCTPDPEGVVKYASLWDSLRTHRLYDPATPAFRDGLRLLRQRGYTEAGVVAGEHFGPQLVVGIRLVRSQPLALEAYRGLVPSSWLDMEAGHAKYTAYIYGRNRAWLHRSGPVRRRSVMCEMCGERPANQVHHRTYKWLYFERPEDLLHVCDECHSGYHASRCRPIPSPP